MVTIDKAGRVVIPAAIRKRLGLEPGTEIKLQVEGFSLHLVRAVPGPQLVERRGRLLARPRVPEGERPVVDVARLDRGRAGAMAGLSGVFFDTSELVAGMVDLGGSSQAPIELLDAVADGRISRRAPPGTVASSSSP